MEAPGSGDVVTTEQLRRENSELKEKLKQQEAARFAAEDSLTRFLSLVRLKTQQLFHKESALVTHEVLAETKGEETLQAVRSRMAELSKSLEEHERRRVELATSVDKASRSRLRREEKGEGSMNDVVIPLFKMWDVDRDIIKCLTERMEWMQLERTLSSSGEEDRKEHLTEQKCLVAELLKEKKSVLQDIARLRESVGVLKVSVSCLEGENEKLEKDLQDTTEALELERRGWANEREMLVKQWESYVDKIRQEFDEYVNGYASEKLFGR
eukprot:TRINITY_DN58050_c0_g1_i3.p1 TRINITY_DN58050_c0_g1~~TRINITY_DN58050_c0_g1_i3.p1  ORF type:complete len:269 (+),score=96.11 TRINITY_DN58050_c0_g1_i3:150-956(+)